MHCFSKFVLGCFFYGAVGSLAFTSTGISGRIGDHYRMEPVSRAVAYKYVKKLETNAINNDVPEFVATELSQARELFTCKKREEMLVTYINEDGSVEPDYVVMYRKTCNTPTVYTIEALLVNCDNEVQMPIQVVERVLRHFCGEHRGHLQTYPLKTWSGGRYAKVMMLERSVEA